MKDPDIFRREHPEDKIDFKPAKNKEYLVSSGDREKICIECGNTFKPFLNNRLTCSQKCRDDRQRKKIAAWKERNPEYWKKYRKDI